MHTHTHTLSITLSICIVYLHRYMDTIHNKHTHTDISPGNPIRGQKRKEKNMIISLVREYLEVETKPRLCCCWLKCVEQGELHPSRVDLRVLRARTYLMCFD